MNYDKRIKDYHEIRCFASRNNRECMGKVGYFAEDISEFENLDNCEMGICFFKDGEEFPFYRFNHPIRRLAHPEKAYPLFCPAYAVDESQSDRELMTLMEEKNADILCHKIYTILRPLTFIRYGSQEHKSANLILRGIKETLQAYFIEREKEE